MKINLARWILTLALGCGVSLSGHAALAATPAGAEAQGLPSAAPMVSDIALQEGGVLVGQIMDPQGAPRAAAKVAIIHNGSTVATTSTDAQGRFTVRNLRGGVHQIASSESQGVYRFWAAQTAPPAATQGVLMVEEGAVVRAQGRHRRRADRHHALICGAIATGIGVGFVSALDDDKPGS